MSEILLKELWDQINLKKLPVHVAVIMDGNGRWAKRQGKPRIFGHRKGVQSVRETVEVAAELGVKYLTLYAFSTENWKRPRLEVNALMQLLVETIGKEVATLNKNKINLKAIGDLPRLPSRSYKALMKGIEDTKHNNHMTLVLALNYSARWEILQAVKDLTKRAVDGQIASGDIDEETFVNTLSTKDMPDPELLIRTSGESRISNFLLWQIAYSELYFTPVFWPDFRKEHFLRAIIDYQRRERRFGKISEQVVY